MNNEDIEQIFRSSNDSNELFDAFQTALSLEIDDVELYKILLGNPTLSFDEIAMYTEKLANEFTKFGFDIYLWTAKLLETKSLNIDALETALHYYAKAAQINPTDHTPFINAINLYNYEMVFNLNKLIEEFVESGIHSVMKKSLLYKTLADHFKKTGDLESQKKYLHLYEKSSGGSLNQ